MIVYNKYMSKVKNITNSLKTFKVNTSKTKYKAKLRKLSAANKLFLTSIGLIPV